MIIITKTLFIWNRQWKAVTFILQEKMQFEHLMILQGLWALVLYKAHLTSPPFHVFMPSSLSCFSDCSWWVLRTFGSVVEMTLNSGNFLTFLTKTLAGQVKLTTFFNEDLSAGELLNILFNAFVFFLGPCSHSMTVALRPKQRDKIEWNSSKLSLVNNLSS